MFSYAGRSAENLMSAALPWTHETFYGRFRIVLNGKCRERFLTFQKKNSPEHLDVLLGFLGFFLHLLYGFQEVSGCYVRS